MNQEGKVAYSNDHFWEFLRQTQVKKLDPLSQFSVRTFLQQFQSDNREVFGEIISPRIFDVLLEIDSKDVVEVDPYMIGQLRIISGIWRQVDSSVQQYISLNFPSFIDSRPSLAEDIDQEEREEVKKHFKILVDYLAEE
jgi:hypothetical protein